MSPTRTSFAQDSAELESIVSFMRNSSSVKKVGSRNTQSRKIWISGDSAVLHIGPEISKPQISIKFVSILEVLKGYRGAKHPELTLAITLKNRPALVLEFESSVIRSNWYKGISHLVLSERRKSNFKDISDDEIQGFSE